MKIFVESKKEHTTFVFETSKITHISKQDYIISNDSVLYIYTDGGRAESISYGYNKKARDEEFDRILKEWSNDEIETEAPDLSPIQTYSPFDE